MGAMIGLVAVLGLAVRHLLQTLHHYQQAREGGAAFDSELVLEGSRARFGSILTSTVVTALAVLPFVIFGNVAGLEVLSPMGMVVLGGLVTREVDAHVDVAERTRGVGQHVVDHAGLSKPPRNGRVDWSTAITHPHCFLDGVSSLHLP